MRKQLENETRVTQHHLVFHNGEILFCFLTSSYCLLNLCLSSTNCCCSCLQSFLLVLVVLSRKSLHLFDGKKVTHQKLVDSILQCHLVVVSPEQTRYSAR